MLASLRPLGACLHRAMNASTRAIKHSVDLDEDIEQIIEIVRQSSSTLGRQASS
jgi:DNA-directed RNA polymerase sigma subunit (sigma70/sigma32)